MGAQIARDGDLGQKKQIKNLRAPHPSAIDQRISND
jgi:hypothetical protein